MHKMFISLTLTYLALTLAACRGDSTGTAPPGLTPGLLASRYEGDDPPRFSDWSAPVNLGPVVNSELEELDPFVSKDGLSLYFGSLRSGGYGGVDIWVAQRPSVDAPWGPAQNLGPTINTPFNDGQPALSPDGHRLFFNSNRSGGFGAADLYVSRRHDKRDDFSWEAPENLGAQVNTAAGETGPTLFDDDAAGTIMLYFASNRPGGPGGNDIYSSAQLADGTFAPAALVPELSSPLDDAAPVVRRDGLEMLLSSTRLGALGGQDIWVATRARTSDPWSTPADLGPLINTVNFEGGAALSFDGTTLYFHAAHRDGNVGTEGRFDLWMSTRRKLAEEGTDRRGRDDNGYDADDAPRFSNWSAPVNLGPVVNTPFVDSDPFLSRDGLSLYFVAGQGRGGSGLRDIWVAQRASTSDPWGPPRNLGPTVNSAGQENSPTLSLDGHRLYFASNRTAVGSLGGFDLYVSRRRDNRDDFGWEAPVNLGSAINTAADETDAAFLEDEATGVTILYFTSNRPGGPGGDDIYASTLQADGTFGPAALVAELDTPSDDMQPAIRRDGLEIFLGSDRPGTNGASDLWVATRASTADPWSVPVNLGPIVNSPPRPPDVEQSNDFRPSLSFNGTALYFASALRPGNVSGMFDLWVTTRIRLGGDGDHNDVKER